MRRMENYREQRGGGGGERKMDRVEEWGGWELRNGEITGADKTPP